MTALVVLGAAAAAIASPIASVFWIVVTANFLLGQHENIPFSTYAMFSRPATTAWALRFENPTGELVALGDMGIGPHIVRKRFEAELRAARERGVSDVAEARRSAGLVVAALVDQHRPAGGPLSAAPITIVLVEHILESGRLRTIKTPIVVAAPQ